MKILCPFFSRRDLFGGWFSGLVLMFFGFFLAACSTSTELPPPTLTITPPPEPTLEPTVVWFPPTPTFTPFPTSPVTPTPDWKVGIGSRILSDDFSDPTLWDLKSTEAGNVSLAGGELTVAITAPRGFLFSARQDPVVGNYFAEISAQVSLCKGTDEYGLLVRVTPNLDYYRYSLSCDGQVRLDRIYRGGAGALQPWTIGGFLPGAPNRVRIGVWVMGEEMRFFVDGQHQFTVRDPLITTGSLGVFARAAGETAVTVSFSDLAIYQVEAEAP